MLASRRLAALLTAILVVAAACSGTGTSSSASSAPAAPAVTVPSTPTVAAAPTATTSPTPTPIAVLDGEPWIVYQWLPKDKDGNALYLMRPDGSDAHEIATDLPGGEHPDWSPDGTLIAINVMVKEGVFEIWTVRADGTDPQKLLACEAAPCVEVGGRPGPPMAGNWSSGE